MESTPFIYILFYLWVMVFMGGNLLRYYIIRRGVQKGTTVSYHEKETITTACIKTVKVYRVFLFLLPVNLIVIPSILYLHKSIDFFHFLLTMVLFHAAVILDYTLRLNLVSMLTHNDANSV